MRVLALLAALLLAACDSLTVVPFGAEDGVPPLWYQETFDGLPPTYSPAEWPDGTRAVQLSIWQELTVTAETMPDGDRRVTLERDAYLLDPTLSALYRDFFGVSKIRAIRGLSLDLTELRIGALDRSRLAPPTLYIDGVPVEGGGHDMPHELVTHLRESLLAGEEVRVPFGLVFHLQAEDLDAIPAPLDVYIKVQPTLYVDLLAL